MCSLDRELKNRFSRVIVDVFSTEQDQFSGDPHTMKNSGGHDLGLFRCFGDRVVCGH